MKEAPSTYTSLSRRDIALYLAMLLLALTACKGTPKTPLQTAADNQAKAHTTLEDKRQAKEKADEEFLTASIAAQVADSMMLIAGQNEEKRQKWSQPADTTKKQTPPTSKSKAKK